MRKGSTTIGTASHGAFRLRVGFAATLAALAALAVVAATAGALVVQRPGPDVSYQPLNGAAHTPTRTPLTYHGGPVMHSNTEYGLFWAPSGHPFPSGYKAAMTTYLKDVAADSGKSTNVYSVGTQYTDTSGSRAAYDTSFGQALSDKHAYPSSGCPPYVGLGGPVFTVCLDDAQLSAEVDRFVSTNGLPRGLTNDYFVLLPPDVGQCFDSTGTQCFDTIYCAYHTFNNTGGTTLYASMPDAAVDPSGCGTGEYPNGHANGNADDVFSVLSHEANETITDPRLDAWFDSSGAENGDKCRNTSDDYGPPLGGAAGALFNQDIHGGHYYLQREWGNGFNGCEQRNVLPKATFTAPSSASAGISVHFDGSGSHDSDGSIIAYSWNFGDGASGNGVTKDHTYSTPGNYTVTLTVTDNNGFKKTKSRSITITP